MKGKFGRYALNAAAAKMTATTAISLLLPYSVSGLGGLNLALFAEISKLSLTRISSNLFQGTAALKILVAISLNLASPRFILSGISAVRLPTTDHSSAQKSSKSAQTAVRRWCGEIGSHSRSHSRITSHAILQIKKRQVPLNLGLVFERQVR